MSEKQVILKVKLYQNRTEHRTYLSELQHLIFLILNQKRRFSFLNKAGEANLGLLMGLQCVGRTTILL